MLETNASLLASAMVLSYEVRFACADMIAIKANFSLRLASTRLSKVGREQMFC